MLRIIDRYVLKEALVLTGICVGVFTFVFFVSKLFRVTEMIVDKGIPFLYAMILLVCLTPAFLVFVVPMAFLVGVLTSLGRMSADNEIIALKTSGVGLYRLSPPVIFLSFLTFLFTSFLMLYAVPWGSMNFRETLFKLAEIKAKVDIKERVFNAPFGDLVIYVNKLSQSGRLLEGVMICDETDPEMNNTILAHKGYLTPDPQAQRLALHLFDGTIHSKDVKRQTYRIINFDTYQFNLSLKEEIAKARERGRVKMLEKEMSIGDLREKIKRFKNEGMNVRPQLVELHFKFAMPFAALIFGLLGIPLGIQRTQWGRSLGFVVSLLILLLYYVLYCVGKNFGSSGVIPPILAAWSPNILLGGLGIYLFVKAARESPMPILTWGDKKIEVLKYRWKRFFREV